ncbi:MAG: pyridoxal-phosphate dependent enzyme [Oscillospiraceae bacterium]|nr:pyridoxal-phosphate dependent enzyme [Oscillospiraceae bacterium]
MERWNSPTTDLGECKGNHLWMKREDLIPFSFGGNKARKAALFFREIEKGQFDSVLTYGSGSSNHCRVVANECARRGLACYIISPEEASAYTFNRQMMDLFGADIHTVPVSEVHDTIEAKLAELQSEGLHPYFIEGGGHGRIGTEAYVQCYQEIREQERELGTQFDYVFFASGTGTTHAGLVCGKLLTGDVRQIIGISIARKNPRGREIVLDSIRSYLGDRATEAQIQDATVFLDAYTSGYGKDDNSVTETIETVLKNYGVPLDATYTGKAFLGMTKYIEQTQIRGKNILFLHTGGTPLFFDALRNAHRE